MSQSPDQPKPDAEPQGISLDELSRAYAEALGEGRETAESTGEGPSADAADIAPCDAEDAEQLDAWAELPSSDLSEPNDDPCPISPATILEAMLFVGDPRNEPLAPARAAELMRGVEPDEIPQLVDQLNRRYAAAGCPYHIASEGVGYRLVLGRQFDWLRNRLHGRAREAQLSQAAIDVLAILAYRQPLGGEEVSRLRGSESSHVLTQLVRRRLLRTERRAGSRHVEYYTTERFLEIFGLASLDELPQAEEIDPR